MGFPGLLYADNLVLCGEPEEDLRTMVASFVCRRRKKLTIAFDKVPYKRLIKKIEGLWDSGEFPKMDSRVTGERE